MSVTETTDFKVLELVMEIDINAPVEKVWAGLTTDLTAWWPKDFVFGGEGTVMTFDPVPGGMMKEEWPDGGGMVWGTVLVVKPNELLQTAGDLVSEYGGPSRGHVSYQLAATDDGTRLTLKDVSFGRISDSTAESKQGGWDLLLRQAMKTWCEQG